MAGTPADMCVPLLRTFSGLGFTTAVGIRNLTDLESYRDVSGLQRFSMYDAHTHVRSLMQCWCLALDLTPAAEL